MKSNQWNADQIPDQKGRVAIVTGSSSGTGFETARVLTQKNARVIIAVRNQKKGEDAVQKIRAENEKADVSVILLDLADFKSIKDFAATFKKQFSRLDLLINNAGVMMPPYSKTADGFDLQFGTNHLGHFLLTGLLIELLQKTPDSRVVNVSSSAHKYGKLDFHDLQWEKRKYRPMRGYSDSKMANIMFTYELGRRLGLNGNNPMITAAHPGWTATELQRNAGGFRFFNRFFAQHISMGALPLLYAAAGPDVQSGEYFGPSGFMEMKGYPKRVESNKLSHNEEIAKRLWDVSEELTGIQYPS